MRGWPQPPGVTRRSNSSDFAGLEREDVRGEGGASWQVRVIDAPERPGRISVAPTLGLSILLCALGVVALGVYPRLVVMAALRVASALF